MTESAIRKRFTRRGYSLHKSRKAESVDNLGGYMVVDDRFNAIVAGERFDMFLEDLEEWVKEFDREESE